MADVRFSCVEDGRCWVFSGVEHGRFTFSRCRSWSKRYGRLAKFDARKPSIGHVRHLKIVKRPRSTPEKRKISYVRQLNNEKSAMLDYRKPEIGHDRLPKIDNRPCSTLESAFGNIIVSKSDFLNSDSEQLCSESVMLDTRKT